MACFERGLIILGCGTSTEDDTAVFGYDSTETGVQVTLTIQKSPEPIVRRQTVALTEPNQQRTVVFRNIGNVPFVRKTSLQVEINKVAGEQNLANNTAEYPVIFSYPGSG